MVSRWYDAGLIDVSWGLKDETTAKVTGLLRRRQIELQAAEADLRDLLREESEADAEVKKIASRQ